MLAEGQRVLTKSCRECRVSFILYNFFFLILNSCVVFKSDSGKLVYFFCLSSHKGDVHCLEKVTLK